MQIPNKPRQIMDFILAAARSSHRFGIACLCLGACLAACIYRVELNASPSMHSEFSSIYKVRVFQLKQRYDLPNNLSRYGFTDAVPYPQQLESFLASDSDDPKKHRRAWITISAPVSQEVFSENFPRLKDSEYLLAVALSNGGQVGEHWIDEYPLKQWWKFWSRSVRICVDVGSVYIECPVVTLRFEPAPALKEPLRLSVYQLKQSIDGIGLNWQEFLDGKDPPALRDYLTDPADAAYRFPVAVDLPSDPPVVRHRLVPYTRFLLAVVRNATGSRGTLLLQPVGRGETPTVTFDLSALH